MSRFPPARCALSLTRFGLQVPSYGVVAGCRADRFAVPLMQLRRQSNDAEEDKGAGFNVSPLSPIAGSLHVAVSHGGQILFAKTIIFLDQLSGRMNLKLIAGAEAAPHSTDCGPSSEREMGGGSAAAVIRNKMESRASW